MIASAVLFAKDLERFATFYDAVTGLEQIDRVFNELRALFRQPALTKEDVVRVLEQVIPGFAHIETGKGLDQKM